MNLKNLTTAKSTLRSGSEESKNLFLDLLVKAIDQARSQIIKANGKDVSLAQKNNLPAAFVERLALSNKNIDEISERLKTIKTLNAGLEKIIEKKALESGLILKKIRVPIGVVLIIYEARPEVTVDVAALCIKSGNVAILKGGSEAQHTNAAFFRCIEKALKNSGLPENSVLPAATRTRKELYDLLKNDRHIDLVIARGSYRMVTEVQNRSKIPVLAHAAGGARYYIDKSADPKIVDNIIINAKTSKPAACNSVDAVLIHKDYSGAEVGRLVEMLQKNGVKIKTDNKIRIILKKLTEGKREVSFALNDVSLLSAKDYSTEFLSKTIILKSVDSLEKALDFIAKFGNKHSEGIIATDKDTIDKFRLAVDTAATFINCSTRLHDGFMFGLGAEMGIATGKLHARGPVGLKELTTYSWELYGNGQIRK